MKIKCEPKTSTIPNGTNTWQAEKKTLVDKIVALKSENNHNVLFLKKTQSELSMLLLEKQKFEKELFGKDILFSKEIKKLNLEISNTKSEMFEREKHNGKIISDLKLENQTLTARINQYKTGMMQQKIVKNTVDEIQKENLEYEVESILDHKTTTDGRQYLIHWKGFDSTEDSWEKETNLHCPKLLKAYNRSIKIIKKKRYIFVIKTKKK